MKTLALQNGDLVVTYGGHKTVSGRQKIAQEIALALGEPFGFDPYQKDMGSTLDDFFGEPINDMTDAMIEAEVIRVVNKYISVQQRQVLQDNLQQRQSRFDSSDVVTGVDSVSVTSNLDTILVQLVLRTASGGQVQVSRTVQP